MWTSELFGGFRRQLVRRVKFRVRDSPTAFYYVMRLSKNHRGHLVTRRSDLVIEGYARSANTYAVAAFQIASGGRLAIASHTHLATHIKRACRLGVPCIALVRNPVDAIASLGVRLNVEQFSNEVDAYADFYESILPLRERLMFAHFADITCRMEAVLGEARRRYRLEVEELTNRELAERKVFEVIEAMERADSGTCVVRETHVGRPSRVRAEATERAIAALRRPEYTKGLERCIRVYESISGLTAAGRPDP
jgi:hypothetical protein